MIAYGPDRARFRRIDTNETGQTTTHYVAGGAMEAVISAAGSVTRRVYVAGAAIVIDTETLPGVVTPAETRYLLKDHLGSLDVVTDSSGGVLERLSFDAWGKRRKVDWTAYLDTGGLPATSYSWQGQQITRGFTGHEQLDPVGLVHMNGRVYDPEIGRFLSADAVIQDTTNLQSLNAYSYVLNNPLSFTDPSGYFFKSLFRSIGRFFSSVFRAIGSVFKAVLRSAIGRSIIQIVACANPYAILTCGAAAAGLVLQAGGSVIDAIKAAAFSYVQMAIWPRIHALGDFLRTTGNIGHSVVHGVVGGALSVAQGGSFLQGFATAAIGQTAGLASESVFGQAGTGSWDAVAARTAIASAAGGLGAELTGGKFENGAVTAAFAHLYNAEGGRTIGRAVGGVVGGVWGLIEDGPLGAALGAAIGSKIGGDVLSKLEDRLIQARITTGILVTDQGDVMVFTSIAQTNKHPASGHVEYQAAQYMANTGARVGWLYHNHPNGTCGMCVSNVPSALPSGAMLHIFPRSDAKPSVGYHHGPVTRVGKAR